MAEKIQTEKIQEEQITGGRITGGQVTGGQVNGDQVTQPVSGAEARAEARAEGADEAGATAGVAAAAATPVTYPVAPGVSLNVRSGPGTSFPIIGVLPVGSRVQIVCQTPGTTVSGYYGTSKIWDCIGNGKFVSDAYVYTGSDGYIRPRCA